MFRSEILEQPAALERFLRQERGTVARIAEKIRARQIAYVLIAARGSSDNAATYAKYVFASFNRLTVALAAPSLFTIYQLPPNLQGALVIGISQSGESPDIVAVVEEARRQGAPTIAITNAENPPLARAAEDVIHLHAGEEKSIAATKTYTTQLAALALFSARLARDSARERELDALPAAMARTLALEEPLAQNAARWNALERSVVIGRGYNYATAFEIALKLKELAYLSAEPYSAADFMHGPIASISPGVGVIVIAPRGRAAENLRATAEQLRARGADVVLISDDADVLGAANVPIQLPASVSEWLSPLTAVIPGQLLALHLARVKGFDPDHPRGLTKVTRTR